MASAHIQVPVAIWTSGLLYRKAEARSRRFHRRAPARRLCQSGRVERSRPSDSRRPPHHYELSRELGLVLRSLRPSGSALHDGLRLLFVRLRSHRLRLALRTLRTARLVLDWFGFWRWFVRCNWFWFVRWRRRNWRRFCGCNVCRTHHRRAHVDLNACALGMLSETERLCPACPTRSDRTPRR